MKMAALQRQERAAELGKGCFEEKAASQEAERLGQRAREECRSVVGGAQMRADGQAVVGLN